MMPRADPPRLPGRVNRSPRTKVNLWFRDHPYLLWPLWVGSVTLMFSSLGLVPGAAYHLPQHYPITSDQSALLAVVAIALVLGLVYLVSVPAQSRRYSAVPEVEWLRETCALLQELAGRAEGYASDESHHRRLHRMREWADEAKERAAPSAGPGALPRRPRSDEDFLRWEMAKELYRLEKLIIELHRFVRAGEEERVR